MLVLYQGVVLQLFRINLNLSFELNVEGRSRYVTGFVPSLKSFKMRLGAQIKLGLDKVKIGVVR